MSTIQSCSRSLHFFSNKRIQVIICKELKDLGVKILLKIKGQNWSYDIPVNKCTQKYPIGFPLYFQNSKIREKGMWFWQMIIKGMLFWQTIIKENFPAIPFSPVLPTPLQLHKKNKLYSNFTPTKYLISRQFQ